MLCQYLRAQCYGYISLAGETVIFYLKRGFTNLLLRDIHACCYLCSNLYRVAWSAKFSSVPHLRRASHRAKSKSYIHSDAQMCHKVWVRRCQLRCLRRQFLCFVLTFTGRFGPSDVLEYMRYLLESMFE